ncbi:Subtilisin-like protease SBT3 [Sesamum angolense]|uniref:Subtilisin-like protease SBT3 n=1 Tax=Sesamum angolense TaxID=2727404 RepID=A0AAE1W324_9LAMI|nr:Subtilisin-like protease SBT3 [Sesamum angolense]
MNSARDTDGMELMCRPLLLGAIGRVHRFLAMHQGLLRGMAPNARITMYKALWTKGLIWQTCFHFARQRGAILETLHNGMPWVLNVDASTIDREFQGTLSLGNGASATGLSLYLGISSSTEFPIVYVDACENEDSLKKVGHKIVIYLETSDTLSEQLYYISNANVLGQKIQDYIKSDPMPKANYKFQETGLNTKPTPKLASYSSRGPSQSCPFILKPDSMAPGTSMSCSHATSVAALLKGAHPDWSPAAIRSAVMTTTNVLDNTKSPIKDTRSNNKPVTPLAMGASHIDPNKALDPGLIYDASSEDYINLLCALNFTTKHIQAITRNYIMMTFVLQKLCTLISYHMVSFVCKMKLSFIDGTNMKPDATDPSFEHWIRVDSLVTILILNSISKELVEGFMYTKAARKRLMDLEQSLVKLWEELDVLTLTTQCICNGCTCGASKAATDLASFMQVIQFFMGLGAKFGHVLNQLLKIIILFYVIPLLKYHFENLSDSSLNCYLQFTNLSLTYRLAKTRNGLRLCNRNFRPLNVLEHGRLLLSLHENKLGVVRYSNLTFAQMELLIGIKRAWWIKDIQNLILQMDINNAFLHGHLDEGVYIDPPEGYAASSHDHCLFLKAEDGDFLALLVYVDAILLTGTSLSLLEGVKSYLDKLFIIKDLGHAKYFLGLELARSQHGLHVSQSKFLRGIFTDFGMLDCKPVSTPLPSGLHLSLDLGSLLPHPDHYRHLVGRLLYLGFTRPDISFAASSRDSRRSVTNCCIFLGTSLVSWKTKNQVTVSQSIAKAKYRSMGSTVYELLWISYLLRDFQILVQLPISFWCDNRASLHITTNPIFHERTKHLDIDCHLVRDQFKLGFISPSYMPGKDQVVDFFTKSLSALDFTHLLVKLGMVPPAPPLGGL